MDDWQAFCTWRARLFYGRDKFGLFAHDIAIWLVTIGIELAIMLVVLAPFLEQAVMVAIAWETAVVPEVPAIARKAIVPTITRKTIVPTITGKAIVPTNSIITHLNYSNT